ncbi:MAG: immunoglobulin domain-containing protein [Verrucomicrobiales bacterium]|nr:immunoglobulin domain-containing protein [Verrucomicrobiales bacterium]
MMRLFRLPLMLLTLLLQFAPLVRMASLLPPPAMNMIIILFRWAAGGAAAMGSVQAVAGASTLITSALAGKATNGQPFTVRLTTAPDPAHYWTAAPLPAGIKLQGTSGSTTWFLTGTPTVDGVFRIGLTAKDNSSSGADRTVSATFVLTVVPNGTPPAITQQPQGTVVEPGESATLTATASGTGPLKYQWLFNGERVAGATNATVTLSSLTSSQAGDYALWVTNVAGSVTSHVAAVVVNGPPSVNGEPVALQAPFGGGAQFRVLAGGKLPLSYQWLKDGIALERETNAVLSLTGLNSQSLGSYSVLVLNELGQATSAPALLTLNYGYTTNTASRVAMNASWKYNQTANLDSVKWEDPAFNDTAWSTGTGLLYVGSAALPAAKGTALTLGRLTYYFRTHFNFTGDPATTRLRLNTILDDGAVLYLNGQEILRVGMDTNLVNVVYSTLSNRSVGTAAAEGPFVLSGSHLVEGDNVLAVEVHQTGSSSSDLALGIALTTETGIPNQPVSLVTAITDTEVQEGSPAGFTGAVSGTAPIVYRWLHDGVELAGKTEPTLSIAAVSAADAGLYTLVASNGFGSMTTSARLTLAPPLAPLTVEVEGLLNSQLTLSALVSAGQRYEVESTDGLEPSSWTSVLTHTAVETGKFSWQVDTTTAPARFFRIRRQ